MIVRFFKAIGRFLMGIVAIFTGKANRAAEALEESPDAIKANFEAIIAGYQDDQRTLRDAVSLKEQARMEREDRLAEKETAESDAEALRELFQTRINERIAELAKPGMSKEEAMAACAVDPKFIDLQDQFSKALAEEQDLEGKIEELKADIAAIDEEMEQYRKDFDGLQQEIEKVKEEQADTLSDVALANIEQKSNELRANMRGDANNERRQNMRDLRRRKNADAKASRLASGVDKQQERRTLIEQARAAKASAGVMAGFFEGFADAKAPAPDEKVAAANGAAAKPVADQLPE